MAPNLEVVIPTGWPVLAAQASALGIASTFSFPLHIGAVRLGVFHVLRRQPGDIDEDGYETSLAMGQLITDALLYLQSGLADEDFENLLSTSEGDRIRIHQATGMVAELVKCSIADALALMRARAFRMEITLFELATLVVSQRAWAD